MLTLAWGQGAVAGSSLGGQNALQNDLHTVGPAGVVLHRYQALQPAQQPHRSRARAPLETPHLCPPSGH